MSRCHCVCYTQLPNLRMCLLESYSEKHSPTVKNISPKNRFYFINEIVILKFLEPGNLLDDSADRARTRPYKKKFSDSLFEIILHFFFVSYQNFHKMPADFIFFSRRLTIQTKSLANYVQKYGVILDAVDQWMKFAWNVSGPSYCCMNEL